MASLDDIESLEQGSPADAAQPLASVDPSLAQAAAPADASSILAQATNESASGSPLEASIPEEEAAQASLPTADIPASSSSPASSTSDTSSSADDESSDDKDASAPSSGNPPDTTVKAPPPNPAMAQAIDNAIQNPQVKQYLKDKYGFGSELDDAALKAAQDKALQASKWNNIGRNLNQAGFGFAQLGAGAGYQNIKNQNAPLFDDSEKLIQQPVQNILARRQGILQDQNLQKEQMGSQLMQDQVKTQLALSDPQSPESQAAQKAYLPILQKAGLDTSLLQNASANTIKQVLQQPLEFADKQKQAELVAQNNADMKKLQMQSIEAQREFNNQFKTQSFQDKQLQQAQQGLNKDPQFIQASKGNDSVNSALDSLELAKTNPAAYQAQALDVAKTVLAGAGRLSGAEIKQFAGGSQALTDRLHQIYTQAQSGTITPENYAFTKELLQHMKANNDQTIQQVQQKYAGQLSSRNNGDVGQNLQKITGQSSASPAAAQSNAPSQQMTPDVLKYAQAHNITPEQALQIKLQRTQGQ